MFTLLPFAAVVSADSQPNPPTWPDSVKVFTEDDSKDTIEAAVNAAFTTNGGENNHGEFSDSRFAFLFAPGSYDADVPVGFYTQVLGLGQTPDQVVFTGTKGVHCVEGSSDFHVGALDTFWRSAENFKTQASWQAWDGMDAGMLWAVSQAAPLRSIIVEQNLSLFQYTTGDAAGYGSGGFIANLDVGGKVSSGSQQQWFSRNSKFDEFPNLNWNMVFVGCDGAPANHCGNQGSGPATTVDQTPTIAEKPFISLEDDKYSLNVPALRNDAQGTDYSQGTAIDFSEVYVATDSDSAATINSMLADGLHVVFTPGIYNLDDSISVQRDNTVLLGLGLATLIAANGKPAIKVGDFDGVRVGGLILQAGTEATSSLIEWGETSGRAGDATNPGVMHDIFGRVGGPDHEEVQVDIMVQVNSGNVIGDNLWLWRADHSIQGPVMNGRNPVSHGIQVLGDDVTMYGLSVEHALKDGVDWKGNNGATYFLQTELPYDVDADWGSQYVGYRVADDVTAHKSYGLGIYSYFRDHEVVVDTAIACPESLESSFINPMTIKVNGNGHIAGVINGKCGLVDGQENCSPPTSHGAYICPTRLVLV